MTESLAIHPSIFTALDRLVVRLGNWRVATQAPGVILPEPALFPDQIHGGNIVEVMTIAGKMSADGVVLKEAGVAGGVQTADCAPVVMVSDSTAVVLHISRKTLVRGLLANAATYVVPDDINHIFIGPHICEYHCSYEEEDKLLRQLRYQYPKAVHFHKGKLYLSIRRALKSVFDEWQVHPDKIIEDGRCTYEQLQMPSYRRWLEGGKEGKLTAFKTVVWREV